MYCNTCGKKIDDDSLYCIKCGSYVGPDKKEIYENQTNMYSESNKAISINNKVDSKIKHIIIGIIVTIVIVSVAADVVVVTMLKDESKKNDNRLDVANTDSVMRKVKDSITYAIMDGVDIMEEDGSTAIYYIEDDGEYITSGVNGNERFEEYLEDCLLGVDTTSAADSKKKRIRIKITENDDQGFDIVVEYVK